MKPAIEEISPSLCQIDRYQNPTLLIRDVKSFGLVILNPRAQIDISSSSSYDRVAPFSVEPDAEQSGDSAGIAMH
jgi:hypothetical protein